MLIQRIESEGLSHYSYLLGDAGHAVVIDPRLDVDIYIGLSMDQGMRITDILETHRNEDYLIGSAELASRTGARIWHADSDLPYRYGQSASPGQRWGVGRYTLEALDTPGHTPGSLSYLLREVSGAPWAVFTGDALFAGDVGRVDLLGPDRADDLGRQLYHSIFERILSLGDGILIYPAHGAGSVCGAAIADRPWTSAGIERLLNPRLQVGRDEFVAAGAMAQERPPYFRHMEELNLEGVRVPNLPFPIPLSPKDFQESMSGSVVLDLRSETDYGAAHIPGSQFIWQAGLASLAGWYLSYDTPILLVADGGAEAAVRVLVRQGFDNVRGFLSGGMLAWHMAGHDSHSIPMISVKDLDRILAGGEHPWILDVRSAEEVKKAPFSGANHIHITLLQQRLDKVPRDRPVYIFCGSGMRSMVAASLLKRRGWSDLLVVLGGMAAWSSVVRQQPGAR
ncbi:MAG TPA: MBL fold metallo-hydrolase [Methanotrichaceae archaeon]|nr:MBL fold metallo-hydrolase [Methanotrichaceae archaeon]HQI91478.1 MBL fold metallo-hydrolase [Methanotrichaceae archaeon]HQJ28816.1 MBL fold metallo-hydrolase [Methanotrichaceae archaeon]